MFGRARTMGKLAVVVVSALLVVGCMHTGGATEEQLMRRVQLDMGCPTTQLRMYELDARTRVVDGCGRRVIYVASCEPAHGKVACTWLANSPHPTPYVVRYSYHADRPVQPNGGANGPAGSGTATAAPELPPPPGAVPKPVPVPPDRGQLHVASTGGFCFVMVNGVPRGPTPVGAILVKPGVVKVSCRYAGATQHKQVSIDGGETKRVFFELSSRR